MSEWTPTACILCECNCGIQVALDGRRMTKFRGDKGHPVSRGYVCEKPARLDFYQNDPDRLTSPMRRRDDGTFEAIDWDTAITEIAQRMGAMRDTHGGASIFYYGGGGQGNHLPGAYSTALRRSLGIRFKSGALAQEKTGEFYVSQRVLGGMTRGDFDHCQVAMFLGKNPWQSHGVARARVVLKELAKDPDRTLIVVDPRRTKTARMADIHLQVTPGTDAWLLRALVGVMVQEDLLNHDWLQANAQGVDAVCAAITGADIEHDCAVAGVEPELVRRAARVIASAESFASQEDLGVQMNRHSTLVSYLHRLVMLLPGHFGTPGTHYTAQGMVRFAYGADGKQSPVTGAPVISGLIPCNSIVDEVLTDHPARFRAMWIETANPAHSLADSPRFREALRALETLVVVDVAMTETAQLAHYVLPASSQYEKAEATFFNFEFPDNAFHLRHRIVDPTPGTLSEAEIHSRMSEALGTVTDADLAPLHAAAAQGLDAYVMAFLQHVMPSRRLMGQAAVILYRTLGPTLPEPVREGAVLLGLCLRMAMQDPAPLAAAGFAGPPHVAGTALFRAILDNPSGVLMQRGDWSSMRIPLGHAQLELPDLLALAQELDAPPARDPAFPFILAAGERRAFTANTIIRDPNWRRRDAQGALRMNPSDAAAIGVSTGEQVRLTTRAGAADVHVEVSETMQPGHVSLPNGQGIGAGVSPNELTQTANKDPIAGTPLHKWVEARIEAVQRSK